MKIIKKVSDFRNLLSNVQGPIGLVPTMGALHEGHVALLKKARADCSTIVASIFVNPTQFNVEDDYLNYPKNPSQDLEIMEGQGVDIIFNPELKEVGNSALYLISDLSAQKYSGMLEFILVDDESEDTTSKIIKEIYNLTCYL